MTGDEPRLAVLIMAAGESRRFGSCKLLADIDGKPMLQRSIELAQSTNASYIRIVTGRWHPEIKQAQTSGLIDDINLIYNPDWQQGLGARLPQAFPKSHHCVTKHLYCWPTRSGSRARISSD